MVKSNRLRQRYEGKLIFIIDINGLNSNIITENPRRIVLVRFDYPQLGIICRSTTPTNYYWWGSKRVGKDLILNMVTIKLTFLTHTTVICTFYDLFYFCFSILQIETINLSFGQTKMLPITKLW